MTTTLTWMIGLLLIESDLAFSPACYPQKVSDQIFSARLFVVDDGHVEKSDRIIIPEANETTSHERKSHVLHELEHRTKHVGAVEGSKLIAEKLVQSIERVAGQASQRAGERAGERVAERAGERLAERASERIAERAGERLAERAGERAGERLAERAGERIAQRASERAGERLAEKTGERIAERVGERAGERLAERAGERIAKRASERAGERLAERTGERVAERAGERLAERAGERIAESVGERAGERLAERASERIAERTGERLAEQAGERIVERAGERAGERLAERAGERLAERASERVTERAGERFAERAGERIAERTGERLMMDKVLATATTKHQRPWNHLLDMLTGTSRSKKLLSSPAEHMANQVAERVVVQQQKQRWWPLKNLWESLFRGGELAEHAGELCLERAGERGAGKAASLTAIATKPRVTTRAGREILLRRLGRGALIVVPVLGGVFASFLFRSDIARIREEWRANSSEKNRFNFVCAVFGGAALADGLDTFCHFAIAFSLLTHALGHHQIVLLEELSLFCAFGSILCAVGGEFLSQRMLLARETCERKDPA